jgi:hypothetical protein
MNFSSIPFVASATPDAPPSSLEWIGAGAVAYDEFSTTTPSVAVHASTQVGDMIVVAVKDFQTPVSVIADNTQMLTLLGAYSSPSEVGRLYGVVVAGSVPTTVVVTLLAPDLFQGQCFTARGVTQSAGFLDDGDSGSARTNLTFDSDATDALVLTMYTTPGSFTRTVDVATYPGSGNADINSRWGNDVIFGFIAGVHDGSTGTAINIGVTWTDAPDTGGRWMSVALKP